MSQIDLALEAVLSKIKDGSNHSLREAENQAKQWENENLPGYSYSLAVYMANTEKLPENRQLCGILLKGTLHSKDVNENTSKQARWFEKMPEEAKAKIRNGIYNLLNDAHSLVAKEAAQIIAKIALIELPRKQWPDLINALLNNMTNPNASPNLKKATLETLSFICEEIDADVLASSANQILTAVVQGMRPEEKSKEVKLAATNALLLALNFVKNNFEKPAECAIIFGVVLDAMGDKEEVEVRLAAYSVLTEIAVLHYIKFDPFMQRIFQTTLEVISKVDPDDDESVDLCKFAIEFWSTICDEELANLEEIEYNEENGLETRPDCKVHHFVKGATQSLVPLLTKCLTMQDEDVDPDDYTIPMAASMCLSNVAKTVKDDVVPFITPFVEHNILSQDWRKREAAVNSFGSILEGPKGVIQQLIQQATPILLKNLKDPNIAVKETSAWTIASILRLHPEPTIPIGENVLQNLCETLNDPSPRVAGRACLGIHNFANAYQEEEVNPVGKFYVDVVRMLLICADRADGNTENLRTSAYEALNTVLDTAPASDENLNQILKVMVERLEKTFAIDDLNAQNDLQELLCGVIQVLVSRLGKKLKPAFADTIMTQLIILFRSKKEATHCFEEGMLTVNAIVSVTEAEFSRYMNDLLPHLLTGLSNWQAHQVCNIAVGVVGDIARVLGPAMVPHCDKIITVLLTNLQNRDLDRAVKPTILSVFGDIAWSIGGNFEKYLQIVMHMLKQAADTVIKTQIPDEDYDLIEYLNLLREGICEAYTGISQGLRADGKGEKLFPSLNDIMSFILHIATEKQCNESVKRGAVGILGDLILTFQARVKVAVEHEAIKKLLIDCQSNTEYSKDTNELASWALHLISQM